MRPVEARQGDRAVRSKPPKTWNKLVEGRTCRRVVEGTRSQARARPLFHRSTPGSAKTTTDSCATHRRLLLEATPRRNPSREARTHPSLWRQQAAAHLRSRILLKAGIHSSGDVADYIE